MSCKDVTYPDWCHHTLTALEQEQANIEEVPGGLSEFAAQVALKTTPSRSSIVNGQRLPLPGKSKDSIIRNFQELRNCDLIDCDHRSAEGSTEGSGDDTASAQRRDQLWSCWPP